jgi:methylenetetrahydrofolate--tRNA-(uracil-5-)-methyltransferase
MGLIAGLSAHFMVSGREMPALPDTTAHGSLINYITRAEHKTFQPMNVNFGIFPPLAQKIPKKYRGREYANRALLALDVWIGDVKIS